MTDASPAASGSTPPPALRGGFVGNVAPALLWAGAIFVGGSSGVPQPRLELGLPFDKVNHVVAFLGLQLLSYRALRWGVSGGGRRALRWLAALTAVLVGIALELYQLGLPDRSAEVADVVADAVGAVLGALALGLLG